MNYIVVLYFVLYCCAVINCRFINKNIDCGSYYWSHVHDLKNTCVISNRDMKSDKNNFNRIQVTLENAFGKFNLTSLMINSTKNTLLPKQIGDFPVLENLRVQNTDLKKLFFDGKSNITFLFLGHNQISEIVQNAFHGLLNLKLLYLNNNKLSKIYNETFKRLTYLQVIWLNNNHLKEISSETFSNNMHLQGIKLQFNKIQLIEENTFNHFQEPNGKLTNLDLRGNACIDINTFYFNLTQVITSINKNCSKSINVL